MIHTLAITAMQSDAAERQPIVIFGLIAEAHLSVAINCPVELLYAGPSPTSAV